MVTKQDIIDYYAYLCEVEGHKLSRRQYRELNPEYSSTLIEDIFGSWSEFSNSAYDDNAPRRMESTKKFSKSASKIVISYVVDGQDINEDVLAVLENYCKYNKAELGILWGKAVVRSEGFDKVTYNRIEKYLATRFEFEKDKKCIVQDFLISCSQKNPLLNIDKLSTNLNTIIVGSTKQYLKILPYKQYNPYRLGCSTGTISAVDYKSTVAGYVDQKYHTYGAILLEYNDKQERYVVRNLIYANGKICDLDKEYTNKSVNKIKQVPAMVLGDLHLPDEDEDFIKETQAQFKLLNPKDVMIHDLASWNSISHHDSDKYLTKCKNRTEDTETLEAEVNSVITRLNKFASGFKNIRFNVVNSNHDCFIEKWLNNGEFVKDTANAKIGAKLFLLYLEDKSIFSTLLPKNFRLLTKNTSFNVLGYELSEHGDCGIAGAKGSVNSFNKGFEKIVIGHTHSPEIREKTVVVGTLSKLKLNYNQKGLTTWCGANAVIHQNGTFQLLFL